MNPDDPKLTAYALDELAPAERAEIEQLLRENPAIRTELDETSAFVARLSRELKAEAGEPLTESQRADLLSLASGDAPSAPVVTPMPAPRRRFPHLWLPLAATLAAFAGVWTVYFQPQKLPPLDAPVAPTNDSQPTSEAVSLLKESYFAAPPATPAPGTNQFNPTAALGNIRPSEPASPAAVPTTVSATMTAAVAPSATMPSLNSRAQLEKLREQAESQSKEKNELLARRTDGTSTASAAPAAMPKAAPVPAPLDQIKRKEQSAAETQSYALRSATAKPASAPMPALAMTLSDEGTTVVRSDVAEGRRKLGGGAFNTESYDAITDNAFLAVRENPLSTFSIDVDTASYANVRRFLNQQTRPPKGAVRIEELLNYFTYDYPQPEGDAPFSATMEVATCPWAPEHRLVRVGLKGRELREEKRPASNLVFLIDVSGSMQPENKLPLLKRSLALLVDRLSADDKVAIAVYAGASGTVLEPTSDKREIRAALERLESGGSTNGGAGIQLAYRLAEQSFIKGGVNRVILATDGDFNVGTTNQSALVDLIEQKAKTGVFLTVLGFGMGNLKDSTLEKLADKGNGNYAYIDTLNEARKVLVEQMNGTLVTIAKDVKIQVEFNPAQVGAYRLIGYENRLLAKEDFNDDKKDAGEIGAGHTVTALYEVVPAGKGVPGTPSVDPLKYQAKAEGGARNAEVATSGSAEMLTLKLRYKQPDGDTSKLLEFPLTDRGETWEKSSRDFRFAAAVAGFGMLLRESPHKGSATWESVRELAVEGRGEDRSGYRGEFLTLLDRAKALVR